MKTYYQDKDVLIPFRKVLFVEHKDEQINVYVVENDYFLIEGEEMTAFLSQYTNWLNSSNHS